MTRATLTCSRRPGAPHRCRRDSGSRRAQSGISRLRCLLLRRPARWPDEHSRRFRLFDGVGELLRGSGGQRDARVVDALIDTLRGLLQRGARRNHDGGIEQPRGLAVEARGGLRRKRPPTPALAPKSAPVAAPWSWPVAHPTHPSRRPSPRLERSGSPRSARLSEGRSPRHRRPQRPCRSCRLAQPCRAHCLLSRPILRDRPRLARPRARRKVARIVAHQAGAKLQLW